MKLTRRRIRKKTSRVKRQKVGRKTKNRRKRRRRKNVGGSKVHPTISIFGMGTGGMTERGGYVMSEITENKFNLIYINPSNYEYNFLYQGQAKLHSSRSNLYIPHGNGTVWWKPAVLLNGSTAPPHGYSGHWKYGKQIDGVYYDGPNIVDAVGRKIYKVAPI